ncbi:MAG TPA: hypothetical protein PKW69_14650 [Niabella sp.]|nr:hypothetical protein [Niabella sp.]
MKTFVIGFFKVLGVLIVILFILNSFIRVSDTSGSIGIIEDKLWGHSVWDFVKPPYSENYKRWESASDASEKVADLLAKYGSEDLTLNDEFENYRQQAFEWSRIAYENASAIPEEYLKKSNEELADKYTEYFVKAVGAWKDGFSNKDIDLVEVGIESYNNFLTWMHSKSREDFKGIR